jgi:hypothetical protein
MLAADHRRPPGPELTLRRWPAKNSSRWRTSKTAEPSRAAGSINGSTRRKAGRGPGREAAAELAGEGSDTDGEALSHEVVAVPVVVEMNTGRTA